MTVKSRSSGARTLLLVSYLFQILSHLIKHSFPTFGGQHLTEAKESHYSPTSENPDSFHQLKQKRTHLPHSESLSANGARTLRSSLPPVAPGRAARCAGEMPTTARCFLVCATYKRVYKHTHILTQTHFYNFKLITEIALEIKTKVAPKNKSNCHLIPVSLHLLVMTSFHLFIIWYI